MTDSREEQLSILAAFLIYKVKNDRNIANRITKTTQKRG